MKRIIAISFLLLSSALLFVSPAETRRAHALLASADVSITKTGPASANTTANFSYTITVANAGPDAADNLTWTDTLPSSLVFVSLTQDTGPGMSCTEPDPGDTGTVSCSLASLANSTSAQFTLTVRALSSTPAGSVVSNTANVTTSTFDPT